jgi:hypothetical protein
MLSLLCVLFSVIARLAGRGEASRGTLIFIGINEKSAHEIATACSPPHPASLAMTGKHSATDVFILGGDETRHGTIARYPRTASPLELPCVLNLYKAIHNSVNSRHT